MKKILTLSFIIFSTFISLQSWALPACPSNQNAYKDNCFGIYSWGDGEKYIGEWKDNKFHGQGTYTYASGSKYIGEFKEGKKHGQGIYYYSIHLRIYPHHPRHKSQSNYLYKHFDLRDRQEVPNFVMI